MSYAHDQNRGQTSPSCKRMRVASSDRPIEELLCQICLDAISEPAFNLVAENKLDIAAHDAENFEHKNICHVLNQQCAGCLMDYIESYELDPDKEEKGCPCPTCRIPLRAIPTEQLARRQVVLFQRQSLEFLDECAKINTLVDEARTLPEGQRSELRKRVRKLLAALAAQHKKRMDALAPINGFKTSSWYRDALKLVQTDDSALKAARQNYRNLWPKDANGSERRRQNGGAQSAWEAYDPVLWEQAGARYIDLDNE